jgi:hypothetical protein
MFQIEAGRRGQSRHLVIFIGMGFYAGKFGLRENLRRMSSDADMTTNNPPNVANA